MANSAVSASICGFDIGSDSCFIGIARQGGIEIVLNDYSQRSTPNFVCLGDKQRELGVSAKQKQLTNISNTFSSLVRLVGRSYNRVVASEQIPFPIEQTECGEVAIRCVVNDEEHVFSATQVLAMLITKLRQIAGMPVDCVINCPNHFTDSQRRALSDAARIAGLNPLRILQDMTAVGIYYRFYRLSNSTEFSLVGFVDIGQSNTQCSIIQFDGKMNQMQVLAVEYESNLGGKHFDEVLLQYFVQNHGLNLNKRARLRLLAECEKLKKQMSANSNSLPISVECLQEDKDFHSRMERSIFEQLSENLLSAIEGVFRRALENAAVNYAAIRNDSKPNDFQLSAVEIVGGSSRIPAIKRLIKDVFGLEASTTLNADEAVARGCALQCAIMSPSFRVAKELEILDYAPYQINCSYWYDNEGDTKIHTCSPLFKRGEVMPFTRQISTNCRSLPMIFELNYTGDNSTFPIGQFKVFADSPVSLQDYKLKVKIRLDGSGMVNITTATLTYDEKNKKNKADSVDNANIPAAGEEKMDVDSQQPPTGNSEDGKNGAKSAEKSAETAAPVKASVSLRVEPLWVRGKLSDEELSRAIEVESNLILSDRKWNERIDARNELEGYVYEWRDKLESQEWHCFMTPDVKTSFMESLDATQRWLYEDEDNGSAQSRSVYLKKLTELQEGFSNSVSFRKKEYSERNHHLERLDNILQSSARLRGCIEEVDKDKLDRAMKLSDEKRSWYLSVCEELKQCPLWKDPPFTIAQIIAVSQEVEAAVRAVDEDISRKKMEKQREEERLRAEEEKKAAAAAAGTTAENADNPDIHSGKQPAAQQATNGESQASDQPMDVDA